MLRLIRNTDHSSGSEGFLNEFLGNTQNGKLTKRILDEFGLEATAANVIEEDEEGEPVYSVVVNVRPMN